MLKTLCTTALVAVAALSGGAEAGNVKVEICDVTVYKNAAYRVLGNLDGSHIELQTKMGRCTKGSGAQKAGLLNRLGGMKQDWNCDELVQKGAKETEFGKCNTDGHGKLKQKHEAACKHTYDEYSRPSMSFSGGKGDAVRIELMDLDALRDDELGGITMQVVDTDGECREHEFHYWTMGITKWSQAHGIKQGKIGIKVTID